MGNKDPDQAAQISHCLPVTRNFFSHCGIYTVRRAFLSHGTQKILYYRGIVKKGYLMIILGLFSPVLHKNIILWVLIRSTLVKHF